MIDTAARQQDDVQGRGGIDGQGAKELAGQAFYSIALYRQAHMFPGDDQAQAVGLARIGPGQKQQVAV